MLFYIPSSKTKKDLAHIILYHAENTIMNQYLLFCIYLAAWLKTRYFNVNMNDILHSDAKMFIKFKIFCWILIARIILIYLGNHDSSKYVQSSLIGSVEKKAIKLKS